MSRSAFACCASNYAGGGEDEAGWDDVLTNERWHMMIRFGADWTFSAKVAWVLIGQWPLPRGR